ncbi:MAG: lycopene cyclase family protein [Ekhidna sp.]
MDQKLYDYAIVGAGAAGLHLALKMVADPFFKSKQILIVEMDAKTSNDRTWCFWEEGKTKWDKIATHSWENGLFINQKETVSFDLHPYRYKMIRSADFYRYAKEQLRKHPSLYWVRDKVKAVDDQMIIATNNSYQALHTFDSRIPKAFYREKASYHSLIQHFKGWFIKTKADVFTPGTFTMMDYRLKWKDSTSFTYVLPTSKNEALVEFTLFNDTMLDDPTYEKYLKTYIRKYLGLEDYEITEIEKGIIPMSDYPFHKHHEPHVTKIGTAGGWVRPSSGYSFKNCDRYSTMMVQNIKKGKKPHKGIGTSRFRKYDSIFLNVLASRNDYGEDIFTRLYTKPHIHSVFRFLDEKSSFGEDLRVMFSLNKPQFWKAFFNTLFK